VKALSLSPNTGKKKKRKKERKEKEMDTPFMVLESISMASKFVSVPCSVLINFRPCTTIVI
jgi:hypothetical protein